MQKLTLAMLALAGVLAVPGAIGAYVSTGDLTGALADVAPVPADAPIFYFNDDGTIWQESNGLAGLQMEAITDELGNVIAQADTNVAGGDIGSLPAVPELGAPEVPAVPAVPEVGAPALPELPALPTL